MNDRNKDRREELRRESDQAAAVAANEVRELRVMVDVLKNDLEAARETIAELERVNDNLVDQLDEVPAPAAAGDDQLRALAATIRNAQRNGHPDAAKHVDALLRLLGA